MTLDCDPSRITRVLLADGWHRVHGTTARCDRFLGEAPGLTWVEAVQSDWGDVWAVSMHAPLGAVLAVEIPHAARRRA